jgi:predicted PurR-regulated permease PerM
MVLAMTRSTRYPSIASAVALWIIATLVTLFFLRAAGQLLIPIVLGVLISYALEPAVAWLARRHVPRLAGTSLIMLVLLGLLAWGVFSLRDDVRQAVEALPEAARRAREMVASQSGSGAGASIQRAAEELRGTGSTGGAQPKTQSSGGEGQEPAGQPAGGAQQAGGSTSGVTGLIQRGVGSIFALAGHLLVIVFLVFFLLLSGHHVRNRLVEIAGPDGERRRVVATIVDDINAQVQRFLLVRLVTAAVVGALTWAVLAWMGVQNAAVWGILAGVFNSIPYFGPVIVSGGLFVVGLVQGGGMTQALQMSGAALAITSLEGWLLTPPLMGKAERMSVLAVFLGLLLWTWVWGAWGTILAVPMLVVVKSVADHVDSLKPIGRLMAP